MKEIATPKGIFNLKVFNAAGKLLEEYTHDNLIVTLGKTAQAKLVGGGSGWENKKVTEMKFGTDGTDPSSGDTTITAPFTKTVTATFPDSTSVVFEWSLATSEANGKAIQEFGLICADGTLFARRTRAVINKTSDLRLEGTWKIQF